MGRTRAHAHAQVEKIRAHKPTTMLTRRGAFRQRGMDLPKIQTSKQKKTRWSGGREPNSVSPLTIIPRHQPGRGGHNINNKPHPRRRHRPSRVHQGRRQLSGLPDADERRQLHRHRHRHARQQRRRRRRPLAAANGPRHPRAERPKTHGAAVGDPGAAGSKQGLRAGPDDGLPPLRRGGRGHVGPEAAVGGGPEVLVRAEDPGGWWTAAVGLQFAIVAAGPAGALRGHAV